MRGDVFWRHDVDLSLSAALKMAEFEAERGISAHYYLFIQGESPLYSVSEAANCSIQLRKLGHTVGQHVDERDLPTNFRPHSLCREISFHCPTEKVLWKKIPGISSAYEPQWMGRYFADSDGSFKYGDPEPYLQSVPHPVQINLHPEWWFDPGAWKRLSDDEFRQFFHREPFNFVDWRRGRPVYDGEKAFWAFDPRPGNRHCALHVSPTDYEITVSRGYAMIDGQRAVPFLEACDEATGFLRLIFDKEYHAP